MLVLSRREHQAIVVGATVITVLEIDGGRVKLGIQGPRDVPVLRSELLEEIKHENRAAAAASVPVEALATQLRLVGPRP